jgi:peptidoglycan hydrolase CwlO-like protein
MIVDDSLLSELKDLGKSLSKEVEQRLVTDQEMEHQLASVTTVQSQLSDSLVNVGKELVVEKQQRVAADEDLLSRLMAERERLTTVQTQLSDTESNIKTLLHTLSSQEASLKELINSYDSRLGDDNAFQLNKYWRFVTKGPRHQTLSIQYRKSVSDKWSASSPFFNL